MAKQEEIRKGINMKAPIPQVINVELLKLLDNYDKYKSVADGLSKDYVSLDEYLAQAIAGIMQGLHSQGVVIKVERELPKVDITTDSFPMDCNKICHQVEQENMLKWHNDNLESLIEEE